MSAIDELRGKVDALAEQLADAQRLWLIVSKRQDDVATLATATDRLSASTEGVDETLRTVGHAMQTAREAKAEAENATVRVDESLVELAKSEHRYRRRSRLLAAAALAVSLLATGGTALYLLHITNQTNSARFELCLAREKYDQVNHRSVGADVTYYRTQLHLIHTNRVNTAALIHTFPPEQAAKLRIEEHKSIQALKTALAEKRQAFAAGVVGQCGSLPH